MIFSTTAPDNFTTPGVHTFTPAAMTGTGWLIQPGMLLILDSGLSNQETILVTATASTTFTATTTIAHNGATTAITINGTVGAVTSYSPANNLISPYSGCPVNKSDTIDLPFVTKALYVGGAGDITVTMAGGETNILLKAVPLGKLDIQVTRIWSTGTAATNIIALW